MDAWLTIPQCPALSQDTLCYNLPRMGATEVSSGREVGQARPRRSPGLGPWLILLVVLLGFGARAWRLGAQSLWVDEGISVLFSSRPLAELLGTVIAQD